MVELAAEAVTRVVIGAVAAVAEAAAMEEAPLLEVVATGFALAAAVWRWLAVGALRWLAGAARPRAV